MVDLKSNEITANREILKKTKVENVFFTWDALGTQKENVELVNHGGGFYLAQVKLNQKSLLEAIKENIDSNNNRPYVVLEEIFKDKKIIREYYLTNSIQGIDANIWSGVQSVGKIRKIIISDGKRIN